MSDPERPAEHVYATARALDKARAQGAPDHLLAAWLQARRAWWGGAIWPAVDDLVKIVNDPRVSAIDPMVTAAIKRQLKH